MIQETTFVIYFEVLIQVIDRIYRFFIDQYGNMHKQPPFRDLNSALRYKSEIAAKVNEFPLWL